MKAFRILAGTLASLALLSPAGADVRTLHLTQTLVPPPNQTFTQWGQAVAIDGSAIIVVAAREAGQVALLYQRGSNNNYTYRRVLASTTGPLVRTSVRMKNGIAAVQFGDAIFIFELSGSDYVPGPSAAPIRHPGGLAISGNSILIGGDDCDYDAVVYQKGTDGNWGITGRLDDNAGECRPQGLDVELNYDYALLRVPSSHEVHAWRRNGTALAWVPAGDMSVSPDIAMSDGPAALQKSTAVTPGSVVFRRSGTTWTQQGILMPVDYANGTVPIYDVKYRDGVLLTNEFWPNGNAAQPYAYLETSPGQFEHFAILQSFVSTVNLDVSGRTVVATRQDDRGRREVVLFVLPTQLKAPSPILNDFEDRDLSDFTFSGGQYALATRGTDDVLTQDSATGLGIALMNDSETSDYQRVEADINPISSATGGWVGLVTRYVDADNYYYVAIRRDNSFGLYLRLNGADTLLADGTSLGASPTHVTLIADDGGLRMQISRQDNILTGLPVATTTNTTLRHGRAGVATYRSRADFDDVRFTATEQIILMTKDYDNYGYDFGRPFTERGGDWRVMENESGDPIAIQQLDMSGYALATIGTPVANQEIITLAAVHSFGSSQEGAWLGLLARFVDAGNYYYVAVRNSNQIQIRKKVNGVITTLASANFTAVPGQSYAFRFRVIGDMLQVFVNQALVASAHDGEIKSGQYGIGTYRAAATWANFTVVQP